MANYVLIFAMAILLLQLVAAATDLLSDDEDLKIPGVDAVETQEEEQQQKYIVCENFSCFTITVRWSCNSKLTPGKISRMEFKTSDNLEIIFNQTFNVFQWHMDFMPTGYLPDSVYRELAWYGILQIQPLHHSAKYKVAAQLIWQHTLGRPHVIMENPPQSTQSPGKVSRQILAEEAAKWSREQRAAQEVLMENIKSGGNGLTIRTVVSSRKKTVYIIQNGNYYKCPPGSEPDVDAYRVQANMHERKCTFGRESIPVPLDPCIEAEVAPIEYSFHEGWMFCLGNGERENNYFQNGTLDCGNKTKIAVDEFLNECAFDNNIVITFDYFGDEPRKDMMHNATLCSTWDPCRLSYLYRLEPPPAEMQPMFPTSTENPCETTVCPECMEGNEEEQGYAMPDDEFELQTETV